MRRILAIGGGGFLMEDGLSPVDRLIVRLAACTRPKICFVGTASGDLPLHLDRFHTAYDGMDCDSSHLAFFRHADSRAIQTSDFRTRLLEQDVIYVGGGNTKSALAVWREWGLDKVLREAWENGVLLAGMSAGAMCWFDAGLTDSFWGAGYRPLNCLGFLPGSCAVHYSDAPKRRETLHAAQRAGAIPDAIAIDDYAAVLYTDTVLDRVFSWQENATAYRVMRDGDGVVERALVSERIAFSHP
jgi:peptidase E